MNIAVDTLVSRDPGTLHGFVISASVSGGDATFYDGTSTAAGRKILKAKGLANISYDVNFRVPLYCPRGLYVDIGSNIDEVLVLWEPLAGEPAGF
jgi:hypothetical protein